MANLESLKDYFTPETFAKMEQEFSSYADEHPEEKVRFENVSTGNYVSASKLSKANKTIERLEGEIANLEASVTGDAEATQKIEQLQQQIEVMKRQAAEQESENALAERFSEAKGDGEFVNAFTETEVRRAFKAALDMPANKGKSDKEILASVVDGKGDVYKNPHKPNDIHPMGNIDSEMDAERFNGLSLSEQMEFANTHSEQYQRIMNKSTR